MSVSGAVIYVVHPVVDRATVERGKIIPRQHVARLENRVIKGDSTNEWIVGGVASTHYRLF